MDSKATPLIDTDAKLFLTSEGSVGIILSNVIPASMKANEYDTSVAFTGKDLISCKCTCMCGGQGEEAIVCVHVLPLIFLFSLLLTEGLAENILLELCARFQATNEANMEERLREKMRKNINLLMLAAGESEDFSNRSIVESLSIFQVGTQKRKILLLVFLIQVRLVQ